MSIKLFVKIITSLLIALAVCFTCGRAPLLAADLQKLERGHFVVYHQNRTLANKLSWKAEYHYKRIVNHFGVREFRPWEGNGKCPIYLYKTQRDFQQATGAPEWSVGLAQFNPFRFASYEKAPNLFKDTLPHEMTHMLLYLFMDKKRVPLWLTEGMAQFEEEGQRSRYRSRTLLKWYLRRGEHMKLEELFKVPFLPANTPQEQIDLFYVQSASVVDHLITGNIRTNFGRFLSNLKGGMTVENALIKAYQWKYKNGISDLEKRWRDFVKRKY